MIYLDLKSIFLILVGIINLIYGLIIYLRNRKSQINFWFFLVVLSVTFWVFAMFFFRLSKESSELLARVLYLSAALIPISFLYFSFVFPEEKNVFETWKKYLLFLPLVVISLLSIAPNMLILNVDIIPGEEKIILFNQKIHLIYGLYIIIYFLWAYINLFQKYIKSSGILKTQIKYIFVSTLISTTIGVTTNLIMPFLGIFTLNWLGQVMTIIMITFIAYAIVKHHLMNVKVIATEIFAVSIVFIILVELFLTKTNEELIVRIVILFLVGFFAYLLVRGVLKEVKTREQIEGLAKDLEKANARLRELDEAKSEFVTIASHQLRAPITSVKGYASMLAEGSFGAIPKKAKTALERILQSSDHLVNLVNDFLNLSRIERGKMEYDFKEFDLKELVKIVFDDFNQINIKREIPLELSLDIDENAKYIVKADKEKIRQAMNNVADNALKYTEKGFIKISLYKNPEKNTIIFKVQDSGTGMDKEFMARIFQKFTRASDGTLSMYVEGTGLGLYVAREIMKAHNGDVRAESEGLGKGSVFYMEFPVIFTPAIDNDGFENIEKINVEKFIKSI